MHHLNTPSVQKIPPLPERCTCIAPRNIPLVGQFKYKYRQFRWPLFSEDEMLPGRRSGHVSDIFVQNFLESDEKNYYLYLT
jgi:hypothetical protein